MAKRVTNRKQLTVQKEYNKQYKRIINRIEKKREQGYYFPESKVPTKVSKPSIKSVEKLKKITWREIDKLLRKISPTGEVYSKKKTQEYEKKKRSESAKKGWQTRRQRQKIEKEEGYIDLGSYDIPEEDIGYDDIIDFVLDKISQLPDEATFFVERRANYKDYTGMKDGLKSFLYDIIYSADDSELSSLRDYYYSQEERLTDDIERSKESTQEEVDSAFYDFAIVINGGKTLSLEQNNYLDSYAEYYG